MYEINLRQQFLLVITIKAADCKKIDAMMVGNVIHYTEEHTCYNGFKKMSFRVNVRQAELIRQLLKNITVYD